MKYFLFIEHKCKSLQWIYCYKVILYVIPILTDISPMDHVALLHTDMNSGFKFAAKIGMNSPEK
jgi:hypothetical protein